MHLDTPTLFVTTVVVTFVVGVLFLLSWTQSRHAQALAIWGLAHLIGAVASALLCLRGVIPDPLSIGLANSLTIAGYGLIWSGARDFERRVPLYDTALAGSLVWAGACCIPSFYESLPARVMLASFLGGLYCALTAAEFLRGVREPLASRWPAIVLMSSYAVLYWVRLPLTVLLPLPPTSRIFESPWLAILCFGAVLFTVATAVTFMALIKERAEHEQRVAAATDPLTGLANRRAFVARTKALLAAPREPVSLVLFDLDHFQAINDTFGHEVGDAVLVAFGTAAGAVLPQRALLGRLGGEEFACVLPGHDRDAAVAVADRIRRAIAKIALPELPQLTMRVSAGVAEAQRGSDVDGLLREADTALYRAKRAGRDRVATIADPPERPPLRIAA